MEAYESRRPIGMADVHDRVFLLREGGACGRDVGHSLASVMERGVGV